MPSLSPASVRLPPFSSRTPADFRPNALTLAVDVARASGRPLLDLTVSNPTRSGLLAPPELVLPALASPTSLQYVADARGLRQARDAVARLYLTREGLVVPPERLFLTASTSEAYAFLLKLLANPGESVLVPAPSYPLFEHLLTLEAVRPLPYQARYDQGWYLDRQAVEEALEEDTRAIILVSPNNPTGAWLKQEERVWLAGLCAERGLALISDEVFADFAFGPDSSRVPTLAAYDDVLSFSMGGLSKSLGLPQLKLAWILANGPAASLEPALERLEFITDTYLSVGTPVQVAAPALLDAHARLQAPLRSRVLENRERVLQALPVGGVVTALQAEGGWYLVLRVPRLLTEEAMVVELLERDGVMVHPGFFFDFAREGHLVVSLLTEPAVLTEGLSRILSRVDVWMSEG